jgi:DNA modification methylase
MPARSVDLIYLDPPFNSNQEYNAIYKTETGMPLPDQVEAFCDTWTLDPERERAIRMAPVLMREAGIDDSVAEFWKLWMNALRQTQPKLLAYLSYMVERLLQMRVVLRPNGSIYLHCDPTASHYMKALMDAVFGHQNFRNEIIWKRTSAHSSARRFGPVHDVILFYTRGPKYKWNRVFQPYDGAYIESFYRHEDDRGRYTLGDLTGAGIREGESGLPWRGLDPTEKGRHWAPPRSFPGGEKVPAPVAEALDYLDEIGRISWPDKGGGVPRFKRYLAEMDGVVAQDIITDIPPVSAKDAERTGYRTQKPVRLLERVIQASSNEGDLVFDPFCGCATTIEAAHQLGRLWIGVDIAIHAIKRITATRLRERLNLTVGQHFTIEGVPRNVEGARDLWTRDKYQFQKWAVEQVDGFVTTKRTADGGIDGRLYYALPGATALESMAIEVKGGKNVSIQDVRSLRGVLERDDAAMAGLIVLEPLNARKEQNFRREMAAAGDLEVFKTVYPRMQLLTVDEILEGKRFRTPSVANLGAGKLPLPM